jgi:hypothetical protein
LILPTCIAYLRIRTIVRGPTVDRARRVHSTFDSINQVAKYPDASGLWSNNLFGSAGGKPEAYRHVLRQSSADLPGTGTIYGVT